MRKRKTKNSDHYATSGQEKARPKKGAGRKGYSGKSRKESSQRRRRQGNERASGGKKQRGGQRQSVFKLADLLPDETIKKLRGIENGRTNLKRPTSRK